MVIKRRGIKQYSQRRWGGQEEWWSGRGDEGEQGVGGKKTAVIRELQGRHQPQGTARLCKSKKMRGALRLRI